MIEENKLIEEIIELKEELGRSPKKYEMDNKGQYSGTTYTNRFGSWEEALQLAGLEKAPPKKQISREELLEHLVELENQEEEFPTSKMMSEIGDYSPDIYRYRFGSWQKAIEKSNVTAKRNQIRISKKDLLTEINRLNEKFNRVTQKIMKDKGEYSPRTYYQRFGSWNEALSCSKADINKEFNLSDEQLVDELMRLYKKIGKTPSIPLMDEKGKYSSKVYKSRFGSWNKAIDRAGLSPRNIGSGEENWNWNGGFTGYYGPSWIKQRNKCLKRDDYRCRVCDSENSIKNWNPDVHHIKPSKDWDIEAKHKNMNDLDNLVSLCRKCHMKFEGKWTEFNSDEFVKRCKDMKQKTMEFGNGSNPFS